MKLFSCDFLVRALQYIYQLTKRMLLYTLPGFEISKGKTLSESTVSTKYSSCSYFLLLRFNDEGTPLLCSEKTKRPSTSRAFNALTNSPHFSPGDFTLHNFSLFAPFKLHLIFTAFNDDLKFRNFVHCHRAADVRVHRFAVSHFRQIFPTWNNTAVQNSGRMADHCLIANGNRKLRRYALTVRVHYYLCWIVTSAYPLKLGSWCFPTPVDM